MLAKIIYQIYNMLAKIIYQIYNRYTNGMQVGEWLCWQK